jgi:hypothetical protein
MFNCTQRRLHSSWFLVYRHAMALGCIHSWFREKSSWLQYLLYLLLPFCCDGWTSQFVVQLFMINKNEVVKKKVYFLTLCSYKSRIRLSSIQSLRHAQFKISQELHYWKFMQSSICSLQGMHATYSATCCFLWLCRNFFIYFDYNYLIF